MKDLLFVNNDAVDQIGESTQTHQKDILIMHKGWDKFAPHLGVGIMSRIDDDETAAELKNEIALNFEKDGMTVEDIVIDESGKLFTYASY